MARSIRSNSASRRAASVPLPTFLASIGQRPGRGDCARQHPALHAVRLLLRAELSAGATTGTLMLAGRGRRRDVAVLELAQYYDAGRVTSFSDFATNTLGTLLGGLAAHAPSAPTSGCRSSASRCPADPDAADHLVAGISAVSVRADDRSAQVLECAEADRPDAVADRLRPVPPDRDLAHRLCADRGRSCGGAGALSVWRRCSPSPCWARKVLIVDTT